MLARSSSEMRRPSKLTTERLWANSGPSHLSDNRIRLPREDGGVIGMGWYWPSLPGDEEGVVDSGWYSRSTCTNPPIRSVVAMALPRRLGWSTNHRAATAVVPTAISRHHILIRGRFMPSAPCQLAITPWFRWCRSL